MSEFAIADLTCRAGRLGICPLPGAADMGRLRGWGPDLVLTMVSQPELPDWLPRGLAEHGVAWRHLPIMDFGAPEGATAALWPEAAAQAHAVLTRGGRVLVHCRAGCGRSGMAVLRLLVEAGEAPEAALERLRAVRPCAVETQAQYEWASIPTPSG